MTRQSLRSLCVVGVLLAFMGMGLVAALPHSHAGQAGAQPHACMFCRAQTAQPHVEPPTVPDPAFQWTADAVVLSITPLAFQRAVRLPASRAPPVVAQVSFETS